MGGKGKSKAPVVSWHQQMMECIANGKLERLKGLLSEKGDLSVDELIPITWDYLKQPPERIKGTLLDYAFSLWEREKNRTSNSSQKRAQEFYDNYWHIILALLEAGVRLSTPGSSYRYTAEQVLGWLAKEQSSALDFIRGEISKYIQRPPRTPPPVVESKKVPTAEALAFLARAKAPGLLERLFRRQRKPVATPQEMLKELKNKVGEGLPLSAAGMPSPASIALAPAPQSPASVSAASISPPPPPEKKDILTQIDEAKGNRRLYEIISRKNIEELKGMSLSPEQVNAPILKGNTALHFAAAVNFGKGVRCLLEAKAEVNPRNECGKTPLDVASHNGFFGRVEGVPVGAAAILKEVGGEGQEGNEDSVAAVLGI